MKTLNVQNMYLQIKRGNYPSGCVHQHGLSKLVFCSAILFVRLGGSGLVGLTPIRSLLQAIEGISRDSRRLGVLQSLGLAKGEEDKIRWGGDPVYHAKGHAKRSPVAFRWFCLQTHVYIYMKILLLYIYKYEDNDHI